MKRAVALVIVALILSVQNAYSQKVKYKDLFILLNSKKYEEAEPFLRVFMADPKNSDHANAHFHMALMFEFKANRNDILTQNHLLVNNIDSALYYFTLAKNMIDEKETSKNDEYYQTYSRRDLRTGKFGIKLSDIHLEIENKVKVMTGQKSSLTNLFTHYVRTEKYYTDADSVFLILQNKYKNQNNLFLKAGNTDLANLKLLAAKFDSVRYNFNQYKSYLEKFPESKYNQKITIVDVGRLEEVAIMPIDWKDETIKVRNYREWSASTETVITVELKKLKEHLTTYNNQLDKLTEKIVKDSVSAKNELTALIDQMLAEDLKKYDRNPMPLAIFDYKVKKIQYLDLLFQYDFDELYLKDKIIVAKARAKLGEETLAIVKAIAEFNLPEETIKYPEFFQTIGETGGISTLLANGKREMEEAVNKWTLEMEIIMERMNWGISQADSISLVPAIAQSYKYHTLLVKDSIAEARAIVSGLVSSESKLTFTAIIDEDYEIDTLFAFEMDPFINSVRHEIIPLMQITDLNNILTGFYALKSDTVSRMDLSLISINSVSWTTHLDVPGKISKIIYVPDVEEVKVFIKRNEEDVLALTLDSGGKPKDQ
ncbi:MAG TPA: hypothetical protein VGA21_15845 [Cyclobacteriaceae bacterium]|jgi:hypothetical protein